MLLRAVPALEEDNSVPPSFSKHDRLNPQLLHFRAKLVKLRQYTFSILSLHLAFPRFFVVDAPRITLKMPSICSGQPAIRMKMDQRTVSPEILNWRMASNNTIPTVVERLRLRTRDLSIGTFKTLSGWDSTRQRGNPVVSEPNTRQSPGKKRKS